MQRELLVCVPGPWKDRSEFVASVISQTKGKFIFAGGVLACPQMTDHARLDFTPHDPNMCRAFELAGQGKLLPTTLEQIAKHHGVAFLSFPISIIEQKGRVISFTEALQQCGGIAVKIESAGIAYEWVQWFSRLNSENPFDLYRTFVVLIGDTDYYYSCGMHHFDLADVEVPRSVKVDEAADLMNRFNYWQIVEKPKLASGHTFSISPNSPRYRISLVNDSRHEAFEPFQNPHGMWRFTAMK